MMSSASAMWTEPGPGMLLGCAGQQMGGHCCCAAVQLPLSLLQWLAALDPYQRQALGMCGLRC